jgi:predicted TPR repeat methyltransferase
MTQADDPDDRLSPQLWTERSVAETQEVYSAWARTYEAEVSERGYRTPARIAGMLAAHLPDGDDRPILDFGCGTGLSGLALRQAGLAPLHGTDINAAMLAEAAPRGIYETTFVSEPGALAVAPGAYRAIVAAGVVSLGAAPPETLDLLVGALAPGDLLILSFNDPTLAHGGYEARLSAQVEAGHLVEIARAHGPHLEDVGMGSDVIVLRRG